jgi:hypothetical protein
MSGLRSWLRTADQYCFGFGSPTTLGVLRMLLGFLAFVNWVMIGLDWDAWFGERGYLPNWLGSLWFGQRSELGFHTNLQVPRLNLLEGVTDPRVTIPFYIGVIVCALLTCLGLWTRVTAFLLALGTVTLHHRSGAILHGGDTVLRFATIYLAVTPCGRACSLDRLIAIWKDRESHAPVRVSIWGQRLYQYNMALVYFTTLWLKWDGDKWRNGFVPSLNAPVATYYPERLAEFYRFWVPDFLKSQVMAKITTCGTVIVEFLLGTLVFFPPARKWVLLSGLLMHIYIEYSMNVPLFAFLMVTLYVAFYDGHEIAGWAERWGLRLRRWHVTVRLPKGMELTPRGVAFLDVIDPLKMVAYLPGTGPSWSASRFDGTPIPVSRAIGSRSMGAWVFAWFPGVSKKLDELVQPIPA